MVVEAIRDVRLTRIPHADQVGRQRVHASAEARDNAPPDVRGSGIAVQEHDVGATASFAIRHVGIKRRNVANGGQVVVEGHGQLHAIMSCLHSPRCFAGRPRP
jgi:hypothetical protein